MPRRKFRKPRPRRPGELRLAPTDIPTAEETLLLAGRVVDAHKWHRRIRRWIRQKLRVWRGQQ